MTGPRSRLEAAACRRGSRAAALLAAALAAVSPRLATAATYYVAPPTSGGDDAATGAEDHPWATLGKAAAVVQQGDTVLVRAGTYREWLTLRASGADGAPITFAAYPGESVTLDGTGVDLGDLDASAGLVDILGAHFVVFDGFRLTSSEGAGVRINESASDVTIRNCSFEGAFGFSAIRAGYGPTARVVVENNVIDREVPPDLNCRYATTTPPCWAEMISMSRTDGVVVRGNHIRKNPAGEGIDLKDGARSGLVQGNVVENTHSTAIYIDGRGEVRDIEISGNVVRGAPNVALANESDDAVPYGSVAIIDNVRIVNNVFERNVFGLRIGAWGWLNATGRISNVVVANNVFAGNQYAFDIGEYSGSSVENVIVRNNIFTGTGVRVVRGSVVVDHNLCDEAVESCPGTDVLRGDPLFVDGANGDFHLTSGSPAVDSASAEGAPAVDFDGRPRPLGDAIDRGAFELGDLPDSGAPAVFDASGVSAAVDASGAPDGQAPAPDASRGICDAGYAPDAAAGAGEASGGCGCTSAPAGTLAAGLLAAVSLRARRRSPER